MKPLLKTSIPGPRSRKYLQSLHKAESPHITYGNADFPVFFNRAQGVWITDVDGNRFLDMTSAFAVASLGHGAASVKRAAHRQINEAWHGMGDVHPHAKKLEAAEALLKLLPFKTARLIFSSSGSEAVETALKTAFLYTRKPGVLAFEGAYHGLGYGALQVTHREWFREPFIRQARSFAEFLPFITEGSQNAASVDQALKRLRSFIRHKRPRIGAVIIEPIQGRAGIRPADARFVKGLRRLCSEEKVILIFDEIFSGFARTGHLFAMEKYGVMPDLVCLGKGMANGFPISACAGKKSVMDAWGPSHGEAKHTSTFLGNPLGAAMMLAVMKEIKAKRWVERVRAKGEYFKSRLQDLAVRHPHHIREIRGEGLMLGIEFSRRRMAGRLMTGLLKRGIIVLPSGEHSEVLSLTPPFVIEESEMDLFVAALNDLLNRAE